jgi:ferrochelatase
MNLSPFENPHIALLLIAFLVNIPLGYIREATPRFSFHWFLWIHASIPLIVYLRMAWGTSKSLIPISILFAIIGQLWGARYRAKRMTIKEQESLEQIPSIKPPVSLQNISPKKTVVALLNMGGPKTNADVKAFQEHLFADPLLIRFPLSFLFQKFFAWMLITFRLKETQKRYQMIGGGSPIYSSTENQCRALRTELKNRGLGDIQVTYSFNYSPPYPYETIAEIKNSGRSVFIPLSLYPHYSKATTGSNLYYLKQEAQKQYPALQFLQPSSYHLHPGYIQSFVSRIQEEIKPGESLDDFFILFSAHGLPLYFLTEGDPYPFLISQTVAAILTKLGRTDSWSIAYQSAVGPLQWLKPSTDDMIKALARRGYKKLLIVPVSFVGDHIETTCEIDIEYRHMANKLGIADFRMIKAIEAHPTFIHALADTIESTINLKPVSGQFVEANI